jgi:hypothetical protein
MKKKIFYILIIVGLIFAIPKALPADSGFDAGYSGGGSYSGGSSYDGGSSYSSHDYSSGGSYSGSTEINVDSDVFFFVILIIFAVVIVITVIDTYSKEEALKKNDKKVNNLVDVQVKNALSKIKEVYPNTTEESIINDALNVYKEYAKSVNERDLDNLKTITSDALFIRVKDMFNKYKETNSYSINDNIELKKGFITFLDFYNNELTAMVVINVSENQYFVDEKKEYLRGNKTEPETIPYQITIHKSLGANKIILTNKVLCTNSDYILKDNDERNFGSSLNMNRLLKIDPNLTEENIINEIYKKYEELQYAWSNFDYDKIRTLVSDELYNNYRMQLRTLSSKGERNVMEDIVFIRGSIKYYEITETSINISVELVVKQNDYIIDEYDNIIKGDKIKDHNTYELFVTRAISSKVRDNTCPNCGASLTGDASQTCAHCGASLITLSSDFVITKKRILFQR